MKTVSAALVAPILCGLMAGLPTASAQTGTITVPFEGVDFVVDRYDDSGDTTYEVTFTDFGFTSVYTFDADGFVTDLQAENQRYRFLYRSRNDKLRKVKLLSSGRKLGEESEGAADPAVVHETTPSAMPVVVGETTTAPGGRRRLFECDECLQTWDTVCSNGVDTVCNLEDYGSPLLPTADVAIDVFCNTFGRLCDQRTADDVCDTQCGGDDDEEDCLPPLTITLEYTGGSEEPDDSADSEAYLDLYVIEPGGQTAYWDNSETETGYLQATSNSMTYTLSNGLDADSATGNYIAFADWSEGSAPIYWTMTATTGGGDVLYVEEGVFSGDCGSTSGSPTEGYGPGASRLLSANLGEYVDNGCEEGDVGDELVAFKSHGA